MRITLHKVEAVKKQGVVTREKSAIVFQNSQVILGNFGICCVNISHIKSVVVKTDIGITVLNSSRFFLRQHVLFSEPYIAIITIQKTTAKYETKRWITREIGDLLNA